MPTGRFCTCFGVLPLSGLEKTPTKKRAPSPETSSSAKKIALSEFASSKEPVACAVLGDACVSGGDAHDAPRRKKYLHGIIIYC